MMSTSTESLIKDKIAFLSNSRWQNRKKCPNRSTNNGDLVDKA